MTKSVQKLEQALASPIVIGIANNSYGGQNAYVSDHNISQKLTLISDLSISPLGTIRTVPI